MKKLVYLLCVTILLQSCYSYKNVDVSPNSFETKSSYKLKINGEEKKLKILSFNDSILKVESKKTVNEIKISEIQSLKKRKFSIGKTIAIIVPILLIIVISSAPDWNYERKGNSNPI